MNPVSSIPIDKYLIDTNVLLRRVEVTHPMHAASVQAIRQLFRIGAALFVTPQNLIEFWVVATRPIAVNGLGLTPVQAAAEIVSFKATFALLPDTSAIFPEWEHIAGQYGVAGKQAHDARLVAVMKVHGIGRILTFNIGDFNRYAAGEGIIVVDPVLAARPTP